MVHTFYFDTNIFRDSRINDAKWHDFQCLTDKHNIHCAYPPRIFVEALSNICSNKKDIFPHWQRHLRRLREVCSDYVLPLFQEVLAQFFKVERKVDENLPTGDDWNKLRDIIIDANSYEDYQKEKAVNIKAVTLKGKLCDVKLFENNIRDWRNYYEKLWINHVENISQKMKDLIASGVGDVKRILDGPEFKQAFLDAKISFATGYKVPLISNSSPDKVDELLKPLEAYFSAYKWIIHHRVVGQYSDKNLKNDYNDLELLVYLGYEGFVFITNEKKIRNKIDTSCKQRERILTFDEAMEKLWCQ